MEKKKKRSANEPKRKGRGRGKKEREKKGGVGKRAEERPGLKHFIFLDFRGSTVWKADMKTRGVLLWRKASTTLLPCYAGTTVETTAVHQMLTFRGIPLRSQRPAL